MHPKRKMDVVAHHAVAQQVHEEHACEFLKQMNKVILVSIG